MNLNDGTTPPKDNRMLAVGLCVLAAVALIYSSISHRWLENRKSKWMRVGISLMSTEVCQEDECEKLSNSELMQKAKDAHSESASSAFAPMGLTTMILELVAAVSLLAAAGIGFAKKRLALPILPTTGALLGLMASLITGCVFVATKPGGIGGVGVGIGFWAFGVGAVVGIAGAQMIAKLIKPLDPDVPTDAW